jgi:hypothetical protein
MEISDPMLRCGKVDSTSPLFMMMPSHLFDAASNARGARKHQYKGWNATDFESPD